MNYYNNPKREANRVAIKKVCNILRSNDIKFYMSADACKNVYIAFNGRTYMVTTNTEKNEETGNFFISESESDRFYENDCNGIILYHSGYDCCTVFDRKSVLCCEVESMMRWYRQKNKEAVEVSESEVIASPKKSKAFRAAFLDYATIAKKYGYYELVKLKKPYQSLGDNLVTD